MASDVFALSLLTANLLRQVVQCQVVAKRSNEERWELRWEKMPNFQRLIFITIVKVQNKKSLKIGFVLFFGFKF